MELIYTKLAGPVGPKDTQIALEDSKGIVKNSTVLMINNELLVVVEVLPGNAVKVSRGSAGSVPDSHRAGAVVTIGEPSDFGTFGPPFLRIGHDVLIMSGSGKPVDGEEPAKVKTHRVRKDGGHRPEKEADAAAEPEPVIVPPEPERGTGYKVAGKGSLYIDTEGPGVFQNVGTKELPEWKQIS